MNKRCNEVKHAAVKKEASVKGQLSGEMRMRRRTKIRMYLGEEVWTDERVSAKVLRQDARGMFQEQQGDEFGPGVSQGKSRGRNVRDPWVLFPVGWDAIESS